MNQLGVDLRENESGRVVGRYALPGHAVERLIAETHLEAVASGALPNDGAPLVAARVSLSHADGASPSLRIAVAAREAQYHRDFDSLAVSDDAHALVSRLARAGEIASGLYRYTLCETTPAASAASSLRVRAFARALPPLCVLSLREAGVEAPRCGHPAIYLPACEALRLIAQAAATQEVEVGALLVVMPFLCAEDAPHRLGIYVCEAVPLAEGTSGDAVQLRVTPAALASVPVDERRGTFRGGLAHSHPRDARRADGPAFFLSPDDVGFATAFFWRPYQIQIVIDAHAEDPERALAAFAWVRGRLERVCFRILDDPPIAWRRTNTWQ